MVVKHTSMVPPISFEPLDDDDMDYVEAVTKHYDCEHQPVSDQPRRSLVRHAARASVALATAGAVAAAAIAAVSVR